MMPSDLRLLRGMRQTLSELAGQLENKRQQELALMIDVLISELIKRQDRGLYIKAFDSAKDLAQDFLKLDLGADEKLSGSIARKISELPQSLSATMNSEALGAGLRQATAFLEDAVNACNESGETKSYLENICRWEADLSRPLSAESLRGPEGTRSGIHITVERLQDYLRRKFPDWRNPRVTYLYRVPGGYSKATFLFDVECDGHERESLVIRAEQKATPYFMDGSVITNEFPAIRTARKGGVPVAEPLWLETDEHALGARFFVSRHVKGKNFGDVMGGSSELSVETIKNMMVVLAKIHSVPLDPDDPDLRQSHFYPRLAYATMSDATVAFVKYWREIARKCDFGPSPAIARGFNWLLNNVPKAPAKPVLVHGDFGLHNVMVENEKVAAVLDWEASHVGDPADEFFLLSFALSQHATREQLLDWYRAAGGQPISDYRLKYYDVLNCLKGPSVGYGALRVAEKYPDSDIKGTYVGYRYVCMQLDALSPMIDAAEAAKKNEM